MPLYSQLDLPDDAPEQPKVFNGDEVPKEMDIFYRTFESFLPEGKTIDQCTSEELEKAKHQYRFSPFRPGMAQTISGFGNMM